MSEHNESVYCPTQDADLPPPIPKYMDTPEAIPPVIKEDKQDSLKKDIANLSTIVYDLCTSAESMGEENSKLKNKLKFHKFWHFAWMIVAWALTTLILFSN